MTMGGAFTVDCEVVGAAGATGLAAPGGGAAGSAAMVTSNTEDGRVEDDDRKYPDQSKSDNELIL